jgi:glucose-1-phosphate cytidylyltransferase
MNVTVLAGGIGARLAEETEVTPKPTHDLAGSRSQRDQVIEFSEKPQLREGWINRAFFVLEPKVLDYIEGDDTHWEREPMERLAREGHLS